MSEQVPIHVDATGLSQPLTKLVEVVARGIGKLYEPVATVQQAKADNKAALIHLEGEIERQETLRRALTRIAHVEISRQENIEKVIEFAKQELPPEVSDTPVQSDWINHFFDSVKDVSSEDLQKIWGKVLAGEVTRPGAYMRRTIEFLKSIDAREAEIFRAVLSVCFACPPSEQNWLFVFPSSKATHEAIRAKIGSINWLHHLTDIGLLSTETTQPLVSTLTGKQIFFDGVPYVMHGPASPNATPHKGLQRIEMWVQMRNLTSIGQQLTSVASASLVRDVSLVDRINSELAEVKVSIVRQEKIEAPEPSSGGGQPS